MRIKCAMTILSIFWMANFAWAQKLNRDLFKPSTLVSSEIARKQLQKIYLNSDKRRTFHCGCVFDKLKQVNANICVNGSKSSKQKPKKLAWKSLMPPRIFAGSLKCWEKTSCARSDGKMVKGRQCCSEVSPKFKTRESDMHNIFPMINGTVFSSETENFSGMWEYSYCEKKSGLRKEIRGDASRAYLYMSFQYKIPLDDGLEDTLRNWHFEDPPDAWEEKRNDMIEIIQGNRNPFIDKPELVERVKNF